MCLAISEWIISENNQETAILLLGVFTAIVASIWKAHCSFKKDDQSEVIDLHYELIRGLFEYDDDFVNRHGMRRGINLDFNNPVNLNICSNKYSEDIRRQSGEIEAFIRQKGNVSNIDRITLSLISERLDNIERARRQYQFRLWRAADLIHKNAGQNKSRADNALKSLSNGSTTNAELLLQEIMINLQKFACIRYNHISYMHAQKMNRRQCQAERSALEIATTLAALAEERFEIEASLNLLNNAIDSNAIYSRDKYFICSRLKYLIRTSSEQNDSLNEYCK